MRGPPKQTKTLSVCFGESGGTCRPLMRGISLCEHVTERAVTERAAAIKTPDLEHILVARSLYLSLVGPQVVRH